MVDLLLSENETPALGGTAAAIEPSPLERMILSQSTSEQAPRPLLIDEEPQQQQPHLNQNQQLGSQQQRPLSRFAFSLAMLSAASLCLLNIFLVWSSYLSDSWFDTYLKVSVPWKDMFPSLKDDLDKLLISTNLASLLSMFVGAEQHWASMALLLSSLVIPCLGMILCPSWIISDYNERFIVSTNQMHCRIPRLTFEFFLRLSFLAFFALAILDMGISSIQIENNDTKILITNRIRPGLVCYTLGMACALAVVVILRLANLNCWGPSAAADSTQMHPSSTTPRAPPSRAFQLPWRLSIHDDENGQLQRPLLQEDSEEMMSPQQQQQQRVDNVEVHTEMTTNYHGLAFCKKTIVFEVGLLSTVLWLPALFLELFEVNYEGVASTFMSELTFSFRFWEVSACLWQRGNNAESKEWMLLSVGTIFVLLAYVLPLLATSLCIVSWRTKQSTSRVCRNIVYIIHPCLCGITFALATFLAIPAFGPIGDRILDQETDGICKKFDQVFDASCMSIHARPSLGSFFLLGQSLALEAFVLVTIGWRS